MAATTRSSLVVVLFLVASAAEAASLSSLRRVVRAQVSSAVAVQRARAAILGSFVADAAAMGLHWDYSVAHIKALVGDGDAAFFGAYRDLFR